MLSTDHQPGSPSWLDLGSRDIPATAAFYGEVFGWSFSSAGPEAGGYGFLQQDGRTVAALGGLDEGAAPAWTVYFQTPDADAVVKAAEQAGGTVRVPAFDVMDAGRMACLTDPTGAEFAVWQPARVKGLDAVTVTGSLCWAELHTGDRAAATAFYRTLFGWRSQEVEVPGMTYLTLSTAEGDQQEASFGGVASLEDGHGRSHWLPYFEVADVDGVVTRTTAGGGSVVMAATDAPGIGRMAWLADPAGARFAVISSAQSQS
ncbi:VOC family protein [Kitasatospora sp. NPDC094015]|uniref:VOC family protein n=1 Tax=Kitasatospora sp. NPDC094015 TaxID=3155205 RepID=UPI003323E51F